MTSPISLQGSNSEVLKQDNRGRVRTPVERREALLDEFERSSLSAAKFAAMAGIKYATFANWAQKRRQARRAAAEGGAGSLAEATTRPGPVRLFEAFAEVSGASVPGLQVELPGGARLHVQTPMQLSLAAELLRLLGAGGARAC